MDLLYRKYSGRLITSLISFFKLSNLQLAEDIVHNTFISALTKWSENGMPDDPASWLFKVCKHKALNEFDRLHYKGKIEFRPDQVRTEQYQLDQAFLPHEIKDNRLRLLFATCHPDFSPKSRIILTLKTLAGFKTSEISKGLGMRQEAVKKSLTRTKKQIAMRNIPLRVPYLMQSKQRLNSVHRVLYLIFNEGYSASSGEEIIRKDLCLEAIRLTKSLLDEEKISNKDTEALFSLMLFNAARFDARLSADGEIIELEKQDRSQWDHKLIGQGIIHFNTSKTSGAWSKYHYEAAISSIHCMARSFTETNWTAILKLYDRLLEIDPSPFVLLNKSIALFYSGYPLQALKATKTIKGINNHIYFATLAKMYSALGDMQSAMNCYLDAISRTSLEVEKRFIKRKMDELLAR